MADSGTIDLLLNGFATKKRSEGRSENTIERVMIDVRAFTRDMELDDPSQITNAIAEEWGSLKRQGEFSRNGKGVGESAMYAYYNSIRTFLKYLDSVGIEYPAVRMAIYCHPNYKRLVVLRAGDVAKIANAAHSYEINVLIRLLYCTGMRLSEGLDVTPDDLKHDNTIWVNGKWCVSRHVVLWPDLKTELEELAPDGGFCFTHKYGKKKGERMSRDVAYFFIKQAMVRAGYPDAYPHSLRHTHATEQLRGGASTEHVARQLGHTKIETTRKYLHLITDDIIQSHEQCLPKI